MLSYRHSYHAGNFADVLKHIILVESLEHLTLKETPFDYIDTHSGAGLYDLRSSNAQKLQEFKNGIAKLSLEAFPQLRRYLNIVADCNPQEGFHFYPGSPLIAKLFLRPQDKGWLYELHSQDYTFLGKNIGKCKGVHVANSDGLSGLLSVVPPVSRRALVLIDPSYEVKTEYFDVIDTIVKAHKKFSTGTYIVWYPVVDRQRILAMEKQLLKSGIRNIQRYELGIEADSTEHGMTSSGLFVVNPPWTLHQKMSLVLPQLVQALALSKDAFFKCDVLVSE